MASLGTWPATIRPRNFRLWCHNAQLANASQDNGSEQVVDLVQERWMASMTLPMSRHARGAQIEAFINSFRDKVNHIAFWHFVRPAPRGTMRGTPTLSGNVAQGATSISIATPTGNTLLAGDMFSVSGLLFQVEADAVSVANVLTVTVVNRVRAALTTGADVVWDKPTANFRKMSDTGVEYEPGSVGEIQLTFAEKVS